MHLIREWFASQNQRRFKMGCYYFVLAGAAFFIISLGGFTGIRHGKISSVHNVHYVDCIGSNFLFRGGLPQTGKPLVFNYKGLQRAIMEAGKKAGVEVPSAYYLIDVNLLNIEKPTDAALISVEYQFFKSQPYLGQIQIWGMVGTKLSPTDSLLLSCRDYLARNLDQWLADRLVTRVELLRKWLTGESKNPKPIVIYVHCVAGCDRTGELIGAYYLRYLRKSWEEMNALNRSMCPRNRHFGSKHYRAIQWYALWLNLKHGIPLNWYQNFP